MKVNTEFEIMTVETHDVNIMQHKLFAHILLIDDKKEAKFQLDSGTANLITEIENSDNTFSYVYSVYDVLIWNMHVATEEFKNT